MQYVEQNQLSTFGSERNDLNIVLTPLNPVISWSQETILKNDRVVLFVGCILKSMISCVFCSRRFL